MEIKNFITTIQWGKGMHYVADTFEDESQVIHSLRYHRKRCDKMKERKPSGAKATVRTWKLVEEK